MRIRLTRRDLAKVAGAGALGVAAPASAQPSEGAATQRESAGGFPTGFLWGTATAAYQIEGAVNADGSIPLVPTFVIVRATRGYERRNRDTSPAEPGAASRAARARARGAGDPRAGSSRNCALSRRTSTAFQKTSTGCRYRTDTPCRDNQARKSEFNASIGRPADCSTSLITPAAVPVKSSDALNSRTAL
jgi:Glycosyl hydrolase family 1